MNHRGESIFEEALRRMHEAQLAEVKATLNGPLVRLLLKGEPEKPSYRWLLAPRTR